MLCTCECVRERVPAQVQMRARTRTPPPLRPTRLHEEARRREAGLRLALALLGGEALLSNGGDLVAPRLLVHGDDLVPVVGDLGEARVELGRRHRRRGVCP
eukprot:2354646-Pleurochrysis_carterae.AAC.1